MPEHDASTAARRQEILSALLDLSSERGLHDTPISVIAKHAGISQGLIYHYFGSKEDLVQELYRQVKIAMLSATMGDVNTTAPPKRRFAEAVRKSILYAVAHPREMSFLQQFETLPEYSADWHKEFGELLQPMFDLFEQGHSAGLFKPLPIALLSELAGGTMMAVANGYIARQVTPDDMTLYLVAEACWDAISSHPS